MKLLFAQSGDYADFNADVRVDLFERVAKTGRGRVGWAIKESLLRRKLKPDQRALDLLSISLAVVAADLAGHRSASADGWTRQFALSISVADPDFWNSQRRLLEGMLGFLTTDLWHIEFLPKGFVLSAQSDAQYPQEHSVVLLSGGLDSLIGTIDLTAKGRKPLAVSQLVRGDAEKQKTFANRIGGGLLHLQLNHNAEVPDSENPPSQRARSIAFLAYGVLAATALERYRAGNEVTLHVCENGFIAVNPPLTDVRVGSLSTRTAHPAFLAQYQALLESAGLRVRVQNPYRLKTKGEMLLGCKDQNLVHELGYLSTSCGRFLRSGYKHCGRCVPCLIRRAAFLKWGVADKTEYKYDDLSVDNNERMRFDDVRSALMAIEVAKETGVDRWVGASLSSRFVQDRPALVQAVANGLNELEAFLLAAGVR